MAAPVQAADRSKARDAYTSASNHYNLSEFAEALRDFKEAYRNFADPTILFNVAQCQRQLGAKQEAVYSYRAYLREATDPPNRAEVQQLIASLESALREEASSKARPPGGTLPPEDATPAQHSEVTAPIAVAQPTTAPAVTVDLGAPIPVATRTPVYKKWWLWTGADEGAPIDGAARAAQHRRA